MDAITYTQARENFKETIEKVCKDHEPVIITRQNKKEKAVLISLEDYNSMKETFYLLKSPENAKRLMESIKQIEDGNFSEKELLE